MVEAVADSKVVVRLRRGTYSRLARKLGVSPQAVRQTHLGLKKSARIERALAREKERQNAA